ncbi:MAG: hypothetical protein SOT81_03630 [Treponema sp.]|nr:hypothetical protein [Treponema sp.]
MSDGQNWQTKRRDFQERDFPQIQNKKDFQDKEKKKKTSGKAGNDFPAEERKEKINVAINSTDFFQFVAKCHSLAKLFSGNGEMPFTHQPIFG